jgi:hypothetical protein
MGGKINWELRIKNEKLKRPKDLRYTIYARWELQRTGIFVLSFEI